MTFTDSRNNLLAFVALASLAAASPTLASTPSRSDGSAKPNVLVIVIDDATWDEFVPNLELENINAFAAGSRVYSRFYCSSTCTPTRYQLNFGRYPHRGGIGSAINAATQKGVARTENSLATELGADGYVTALFGKWHLSGTELGGQLEQAAQIHGYDDWMAGKIGNLKLGTGFPPSGEESHAANGWERLDNGVASTATEYSSVAIESAWYDWWASNSGEPKFAMLSFLAPHFPFTAPPASLLPSPLPNNASEREKYEASIVAIDSVLERTLQSVDLSNTFVFILSDNGTPAHKLTGSWNGPHQHYKLSEYEGGIHVPLLVAGPGVAAGLDASLIQACDVPGTILDLCGVTPNSGFEDSIPFTATLDGSAIGTREFAFLHRFKFSASDPTVLVFNNWAIVHRSGYKFIHREGLIPGGGDPIGAIESLFHVVLDPFEQNPLWPMSLPMEVAYLKSLYCGALGSGGTVFGPDCP